MTGGDVAVFLFPSYLCFGYLGDGEKIGINQPLRFTIEMLKIEKKINKNEKKITIYILLLLAVIFGCSDKNPSLDEGLYANLQTSKGEIILQLEIEKTPVTVANFVSLAEGRNEKVSDEI